MRMPAQLAISRAVILAIAFTGASAVAMATAPSASAHSELISAWPAEGQVLKHPPKAVLLTFGEGVVAQGSAIVVTGPDGKRYDVKSSLGVDEEQASVALNPATVSGAYEVAYRVVSIDGHVVQDIYTYRLKLPASASPSSSPTGGPTASETPSPSTSPTVEPSTSPVGSTGSGSDSDGSVVWLLGAGVIGLALLAALIAVMLRRRRG